MTMKTITEVEALRAQLEAEGVSMPGRIRQIAIACLGWPYVFGAWGELCTPKGRLKWYNLNPSHTTIKTKCPNLSSGKACSTCKWGIGVRMYDCRGFTRWLIQQVGLDITGSGATSQYNTAKNWARSGPISEMPDCVCCVFKQKAGTKTMAHTGMHIGGGEIIHCSTNVQTGNTSDKGWTHYAIPIGLYSEGEIPVEIIKPTLRRGSKGDLVKELQERLTALEYPCGNIDGIFGTKTYNALVSFQTDAKLDPDGVCGMKTWAALEAAKPREPEPTYKVVCYGMTWAQSMKIREVCPTATMEKEA